MIGTTLGPFRVLSKLGEGGMGEVYRAHDGRLKRDVALKVIPAAFAADPDRVARFQREAEVLASLNHPHIAQVYGVEDAGGVQALVLELVEGPTLADRIGGGPIAVDEALRLAGQIADALDAAHERGIIHRDLKPSNVKVREDGAVKVLDFGLAKALGSDAAGDGAATTPSLSLSPTITTPAATRAGLILGTAAYMSPEQARGARLDRRADIWAFGCVLFEMLAGRRAFEGAHISDVLASVLKSEPDWDALPATVSPALRHVLRRSLQKDPARRFRDIGDVRFALDDAAAGHEPGTVPATPVAVRRATVAWAAAAVLGATAIALGVMLVRTDSGGAAPLPTRSSIVLPPDQALVRTTLAFSPDGGTLAFASVGDGDGTRICLRHIAEWPIRCLERARGHHPFFSPDGRRIGYFTDNGMWAISVDGASPTRLAATGGVGGSWAPDGSIVFNPSYNQGLARIAAPGEPPTVLTRPDPDAGELGHFWPQVLEDGRTVIFTIFSSQARAAVAALRLETGEVVPLVRDAAFGRYVATGHLLFVRSNTLMAVPFDPADLRIAGTPAAVLDDVVQFPLNGASALAMSADGLLAYASESQWHPQRGLVWADRGGRESPIPDISGPVAGRIALSPDGTRVAAVHAGANPDIYLYELDSGRRTRVTFGDGVEDDPVWTPDGQSLVYLSDRRRAFDLYRLQVDRSGSEEPLWTGEYDKVPWSFSPDGSTLVFGEIRPGETGWDILLLPLEGASREPQVYLRTRADEGSGTVSPSGTLIAYASNETGRREVYVNTFPEPSAARPVSIDGGSDPRWARDGRTLFYRSGQRALEAVTIDPGPPLRVGRPERLFEKAIASYDVAADGRLLLVPAPEGTAPRRIDLVQHWDRELTRLAPLD